MPDTFEETEIGRLVQAFDRTARNDELQQNEGYVSGLIDAARADHAIARAALIAKMKEMQERIAAKDAALKLCIEAMLAVSSRKISNIKVRGREVGIEADDEEKCFAVPSDDMDALEGALAVAKKAGGRNV